MAITQKEHQHDSAILVRVVVRKGGRVKNPVHTVRPFCKMADEEGQEDELIALEAIYEDERMFIRSPEEKGGQLNISLDLPDGFLLKVRSSQVPSSLRSKATESDPDTARGTGSDHLVNVPVKHLPPIVLNFEFPKDYPSRSPPNFTLSCKWLTRLQVNSLIKLTIA